ncbi:MAG: DNA polymerase I [Parcubacteria bacterium C7867-004]|nr:MAG: DNA polymerase I [Parcubacteria bacterium C7867-004]
MPTKKVSTGKTRLVLLDAHAIIHRAYHALPEFTGPDGAPTGALYGLSTMLVRIATDLAPDYIVACYDLPKPTIRHEAYAEYKGSRSKIDDALITQLGTSRDVFKAFSIPIYEREGFEADDILGTIVKMLKKDKDTEIIIASGDMDTMQLIDEKKVQVYTLKKGLNDVILYDEQAVIDRYGFPPELIPDWKGLRGDPSDNIKGVPGIGEKTGTELVQKFGTMENLYKVIKKDEQKLLDAGVKPRILGLLKEHEEDARFSKSLATIRDDAPIAFNLPAKLWRETVMLEKLSTLFDELGFRSLKPRVRTLLGGEDSDESEDEDTVEEVMEDVEPTRLQEACVMLWLLCSEFTNPTLDDVLAYTKAKSFDEAYATLEKGLASTGRLKELYETMEKPLIPVLRAMEKCGVRIDRAMLEKLRKEYRAELEKIEKGIYKMAGREFNVSSPKQLGDVLFDELGLAAKGQKKTATGQRSTKESELEKLREAHPIISEVLKYRGLQKLLGTYIEAIPPLLDEQDRLHTEFLQTGAVTGRMATQNPGLQNIPIRTEQGRAIRHAFIPADGFTLVGLDYSQIELRIAAILSKDEKLSDIFRSGRDVHREVAAAVFGVEPSAVDHEMRRRAKIINFGILYGMGVNALKAQLGTSAAEAHQFYDDYFVTFDTLAKYLESTRGFARKNGFTETMFGRRRQFPEMKSTLPYVRAQAERMAINAPIQGTQADIIKLAMVRIDAMLREAKALDDAHLMLQVHDELVFEIRKEKAKELALKIEEIMESVLTPEETNGIPLLAEAKVGPSWGDLEPL